MKEPVVADAALGIDYILARDLLPWAQSFGTKESSHQKSQRSVIGLFPFSESFSHSKVGLLISQNFISLISFYEKPDIN